MASNLPENLAPKLTQLTNKGFNGATQEQRESLHADLQRVLQEEGVDEHENHGHQPNTCTALQTPQAPDRQDDMTDLQKAREQHIRNAENMNKNLDRLFAGESAENVFGEAWKNAFVSTEDIEGGNVVLHCGCMDERVPDTDGGIKAGMAGSGILMTNLDAPELHTDDVDAIYAFLSDPVSGNDNFRALVTSLKARKQKGARIVVSDHHGCGAARIFCARLNGKNLDPAKAARAAANRLQRALGLEGDAKHADYKQADFLMNRHPHLNDAHCVIIDGTGRFRADKVSTTLRGLKLSAINFLTDVGNEEQNAYLRAELTAGSSIIAGAQGIGLIDAPIVVILDPKNPASRETIENRYNLAQYTSRKIHFVTAPENA